MNELILPLVEHLLSQYPDLDLSRTRILGVQHILETTHSMFRSLYKKGLKPENVSLIGKCYSTNLEVLKEMQEDGIDASNRSYAYNSHLDFDTAFTKDVAQFIEDRREVLETETYDLIVILDDGGKCLKYLKEEHINAKSPLVGVEQTSAGYEKIKDKTLVFPVINVAKEPLKLNLESPMIAQAFFERLFPSIKRVSKGVGNFLIIGGGPIGKCIHDKLLAKHYEADIFDLNQDLSSIDSLVLEKLINQYDCIIGCTGQTSVPHTMHSHFKKGAILASASSSDREFDAVYLRQKLKPSDRCHQDVNIDGIHLINSGFPVNFDGERENIELELIQLTIALIAGAIIQAKVHHEQLNNHIVPLTDELVEVIGKKFQSIQSS